MTAFDKAAALEEKRYVDLSFAQNHPGVQMLVSQPGEAGIPLSIYLPGQDATHLAQRLADPQERALHLSIGVRWRMVSDSDLGAELDRRRGVRGTYYIGLFEGQSAAATLADLL